MVTLTIRKADGSTGAALELSDAVFGVEPNAHCVRAAVDGQMSNRRLGAHATKTRHFVRGGGRKPYRQKGTGRARQGSIRATQWRGGAVAFGPHPRDHSIAVNRKVRRKALVSVLSQLARAGRLLAVEDFGLERPRTAALVKTLEGLGAGKGRVLIITEKLEPNVALSARNLKRVTAQVVDNINIFDLMTHDWVMATPAVLKRLEETYG
jgi:large subunit ribosomal protein L4